MSLFFIFDIPFKLCALIALRINAVAINVIITGTIPHVRNVVIAYFWTVARDFNKGGLKITGTLNDESKIS